MSAQSSVQRSCLLCMTLQLTLYAQWLCAASNSSRHVTPGFDLCHRNLSVVSRKLTTLLQALNREVAVRQKRALFESHMWRLWAVLHASFGMPSRKTLPLEYDT